MARSRYIAALAGLALTLAVMAGVAYADTSPTPTRPVSQCTNFACEP
jgi:hypothetical protein